MNEPKKIWQSKTVWIAVLQIVAGVCLYAIGQLETGSALTVSGIVHTGLRLWTTQPIHP